MYYVLCTMYYVLCTMYYVQCTMYSGVMAFAIIRIANSYHWSSPEWKVFMSDVFMSRYIIKYVYPGNR